MKLNVRRRPDRGGTMTVRHLSRSSDARADAGDDVPAAVVWNAKAAFETRTGMTLVALVFDSAFDGGAANGERQLRFEHRLLRIELVVMYHGHWCALRGRVEPRPLRVKLDLVGAPFTVPDVASGDGFWFDPVPRGLMRLRVVAEDATCRLHTDWFQA
jgi:hypothetical protein